MTVDTTSEAVAESLGTWGFMIAAGCVTTRAMANACALIETLARERDLAVAHDRQPYPTAEAYELVCAARDRWQARAERAEAALASRVDAEYRATFVTDAAARARLADERAGIPMTRLDERGVDLGVGAGVGGGA